MVSNVEPYIKRKVKGLLGGERYQLKGPPNSWSDFKDGKKNSQGTQQKEPVKKRRLKIYHHTEKLLPRHLRTKEVSKGPRVGRRKRR